MKLDKFINNCYKILPFLTNYQFPWEITDHVNEIVEQIIKTLSQQDFVVKERVAIHKTAIVEKNITLKDYVFIGKNCFVGAGAYLRDGVYLDEGVRVGPNCEIKSSVIFKNSRIAHLNYVGNSIIGVDVNLEAAAIIANHFNEKEEKDRAIKVIIDKKVINTGIKKFGSLIGDRSRIGANAVLNPGSILAPKTIIDRLEHFDQLKSKS